MCGLFIVWASPAKAERVKTTRYGDDRDTIKSIKNPRVRFIEVLFDFGEGLADYKEASDYLIEEIINKPDVFKPLTTFKEIRKNNKNYKLDENVKKFYKYFD